MAKSIAALLKEASTYLDRYDLGSALRLYRDVLAREPGNAGAAMGLAMVLNRSGKPSEALQLLRRVWASVSHAKPGLPAEQQAAILAQIGLAQEEMGQLVGALDAYRQAEQLVRSPDLERRIQQIAPLLSSPAPVQQLILRGRQLRADRQLEESATTYIAALKLQQDNPEALHELAMVLQHMGFYDKALPLLQKAAILVPDKPELFNDMGILFQRRGDFPKAVSFHKRAIKLAPDFVFAHINLGVAHKQLGQHAQSLAAYNRALEIDPQSCEAHNNVGNLLRVIGDLPMARKHLQKALKIRPQYPDARANLDAVLQAQAEQRRVARKTAAPSTAPKKLAPKSVPAKKAVAKETAAKKTVAKKAAPAKVAQPKAAARKAPATKSAQKQLPDTSSRAAKRART